MCHHDLSGFQHNLFSRCHDLYNNWHNFSTCIFFWVGTVVYTYSATIYLVSAAIYLIGATLYIIPVLQFDAEDEEGNVSTHDSVLSIEPIKHTETYSLGMNNGSSTVMEVMKTSSSPGAGNRTCSICSRVLASTQSLRNHICSAHMDETCYQCDKCGKILVIPMHFRCTPGNINQKGSHISAGLWQRLCHSRPQGPAYGGPSWKSAPCQYCGTTFTHTRSLVEHERGVT